MFKGLYKYIATSPPLSRRPRPWTRPKTRGCPPHIAAAWLKSYETKQLQKKTVFVEKEKEKKSPDKTDPEQNRPLSVISSPWISRNWRELAATPHKLTFTLKWYFAVFQNRIFIIFRSEQRSFVITVSIVAKKELKKLWQTPPKKCSPTCLIPFVPEARDSSSVVAQISQLFPLCGNEARICPWAWALQIHADQNFPFRFQPPFISVLLSPGFWRPSAHCLGCLPVLEALPWPPA